MWYGESFCWWETLDADVPQISRNGQSDGETFSFFHFHFHFHFLYNWCPADISERSIQWRDKSWRSTWPVWPTNTKCEYIFFFPSLPVIPCPLASIFTRQIYLTNPAPGQSRKSTKSNELFKSVNEGINPSMKLRSIYNGVTRTMQAICTICPSVLWSFSQTTQKPPVTCFKTCDGYLKHRR